MTYPLGRIVQHDPRSRSFAYRAAPRALSSVQHASHIGILDQGDLGSCTGNATVGALGCDPYFPTEVTHLDENLAVHIYAMATTLDDFDEQYPPTDTGSSGLAAAKAAQQLGLISGYRHAFNISDALAALQDGPVITGIDWYQSFFTPSSAGLVSIAPRDTVAGGHEICADGYDAANQLVWFRNSWTEDWGVKGRFCMTVSTWAELLTRDGDATVFTPLNQPAPTPEPKPVVVDGADVSLVAAMEPWRKTILSRITKAGKAAVAYDTWKAAKGL